MKIHPEHLVLLLFAAGFALYLNIDGIPLTHPGNIKAADPFYHVIVTENILDTSQWHFYPLWLSQGHTNMVNIQPPLLYMNAALLSLFSQIPAWAMIYLLVCLTAAISLLLLYLICVELFSKTVGMIAVAFTLLPLSQQAWLYGLYIGFWIQVVGYMFLLAYLWLFIKAWKKQEQWHYIIFGIILAAVLMTHPQDLLVLALPSLLLVLRAWGDWRSMLNIFSLLAVIPFAAFLFFIPRFLFVWNRLGSAGYALAFKGAESLFSKAYLGGLPTPDVTFFPKLTLVAGGIGMLMLLRNWKQFKLWIGVTVYFVIFSYVLPILMASPHYLLRLRALSPYIMFPAVAYFLSSLFVDQLAKKTRLPRFLLAVVICIAAISLSVPEYRVLVSATKGNEHINPVFWNALQWIQTNTKQDSKVLFLEGGYQESALYAKRIAATVPLPRLEENYKQFLAGIFNPAVQVEWTGRTLREADAFQDSLWQYHYVEEWDSAVSMLEFDYVVLVEVHPALAPYNEFVAQQLNAKGYAQVYAQGIIQIYGGQT